MSQGAELREYFEMFCVQELGWICAIAENCQGEMVPYLLNRHSEIDAIIMEIENFEMEVLGIRKYLAEEVEFLEELFNCYPLNDVTQTPQKVIDLLFRTLNHRELE